MADSDDRDDIEIEIDGTRVKVQRRPRPANSNQDALFVHVYDNIEGFGHDYSQYQFVITEETDARRVRYRKKKDAQIPPRTAVEAVHEAGWQLEDEAEMTPVRRVHAAHRILKDVDFDSENYPVAGNLVADAASLTAWVSITVGDVLAGDPDSGRFAEADIETERELYEFLSQENEAAYFFDTFADNQMAVSVLRGETALVYGFDFLEAIKDRTDAQVDVTVHDTAEETDE